MRGHLTPQEAGEHAKRARVKRVLLTHVSDELDELWVRKCAKRAYDGPDRGRPRGRRLRKLRSRGVAMGRPSERASPQALT